MVAHFLCLVRVQQSACFHDFAHSPATFAWCLQAMATKRIVHDGEIDSIRRITPMSTVVQGAGIARPGKSGTEYACHVETVFAGSVECKRSIHAWRRRASMLCKASSASQISNYASSTSGCGMSTRRRPRRYSIKCETLNASCSCIGRSKKGKREGPIRRRCRSHELRPARRGRAATCGSHAMASSHSFHVLDATPCPGRRRQRALASLRRPACTVVPSRPLQAGRRGKA